MFDSLIENVAATIDGKAFALNHGVRKVVIFSWLCITDYLQFVATTVFVIQTFQLQNFVKNSIYFYYWLMSGVTFLCAVCLVAVCSLHLELLHFGTFSQTKEENRITKLKCKPRMNLFNPSYPSPAACEPGAVSSAAVQPCLVIT